MEDQEKLIDALDRIKTTIMEVQTKFSEAAEVFNRKKAYDISQLPNCQHVVEYINYRKRTDHKDNDAFTECDRLIMDGDQIKDIITNAQARFLYAIKILNNNQAQELNEEQRIKAQQEINDATLEFIEYNEMLKSIYSILKIPRTGD